MKRVVSSYLGLWSTVALVVIIGALVTQGLLDGEWADRAFGFIAGSAVGGAATLKVKPPQ